MNAKGQRAAGYIRVSDPSQIDTHSIEAQKAEIGKWCEREGHELVGFYIDLGVSAYKDRSAQRPEFVRLLEDAALGKVDVVVVHTLDRFARNVGVLREAIKRLVDADVGFVSITENFDYSTPAGRMILTNIASASEFFSGMLGIHVQKAQRLRAEKGLPVGPTPFAYGVQEPGGVPVLHKEQGQAVLETFERRDRGEPYSRIAAWLNGEGYLTTKGRPFDEHAVKDLLTCRFYVGVISYKGEELAGRHDAIITEELFQRVQARRHRRAFQRRVDGEHGVLQGRSRCARCGNPLHADHHRSGAPMYRERHCYECSTNGRSLMSHFVDDQVAEIFGALQLPEDWRMRMAKLAAENGKVIDVAKLLERRRRTLRAYAEGAYSDEQLTEKLGQIDAQIRLAQPAPQASLEEAVELLSDLPSLWKEATAQERQRLIAPLIDRAYIDVELRRIAAIAPTPSFRSLLRGALEHVAQPTCILVDATKEIDWAKWWTWWRRGRIELPVQRGVGLRSYRRFRRLDLVQRAIAGPASPNTADRSWAVGIGVRPQHPD